MNSNKSYSFRITLASLFIVGVLLIAGATAHHGWEHYDEDTTLEFSGLIKESGMPPPHSYIKMNVFYEGEIWLVILDSPAQMRKHGVNIEDLLPGTRVSVVGHPHHEKEREMRAEQITIIDRTVDLR